MSGLPLRAKSSGEHIGFAPPLSLSLPISCSTIFQVTSAHDVIRTVIVFKRLKPEDKMLLHTLDRMVFLDLIFQSLLFSEFLGKYLELHPQIKFLATPLKLILLCLYVKTTLNSAYHSRQGTSFEKTVFQITWFFTCFSGFWVVGPFRANWMRVLLSSECESIRFHFLCFFLPSDQVWFFWNRFRNVQKVLSGVLFGFNSGWSFWAESTFLDPCFYPRITRGGIRWVRISYTGLNHLHYTHTCNKTKFQLKQIKFVIYLKNFFPAFADDCHLR